MCGVQVWHEGRIDAGVVDKDIAFVMSQPEAVEVNKIVLRPKSQEL